MESNFRKQEFEHYIKQNADQYRMFPSDKVWKGINNALHTRRRWYGFWLGFLLLVTGGAVTWVMTSQPSPRKETTSTLLNNSSPVSTNNGSTSGKSSQALEDLLSFHKVPTTQASSVTNQTEKSGLVVLPVIIENNTPDEIIGILSVSPNAEIQTGKSLQAIPNKINIGTSIISFPETAFTGVEKAPGEIKPLATLVNSHSNEQSGEIYAPFTIESVTNSYRYSKPAKRISWQLFITPTVSYRRLTVNKSSDNTPAFNFPIATSSDVNNAVTHKPDLGLQIGVSGRYPITRSLKLRAGMQFNINRYDIKAYAFNGEVATIDLNGGNGNNSISTWTYYRNYAGYKSDWLKNYYVSVSAPLGAEMKLIGNEKTNLGVAGTIQPTYILKDRAYLISTDYKNYAEVPRLVRHLNLNTSFETFVNYTNGKTKWQIGPQVRYQILSSFHNNYPIKENLFDFGVKVGVTLNE